MCCSFRQTYGLRIDMSREFMLVFAIYRLYILISYGWWLLLLQHIRGALTLARNLATPPNGRCNISSVICAVTWRTRVIIFGTVPGSFDG